MEIITAPIVLNAYAQGIFPMAESHDSDDLFWCDPDRRGIIPLDGFHTSRSLRKFIKRIDIKVKINENFTQTVTNCAVRPETWINARLFDLYNELHHAGHAHAFEVYFGGKSAGGVFGITLGRAFFGESMYSAQTNGSKVALFYLVHHLQARGFTLFDTQFLTDHLASLGAVEISRSTYRKKLSTALGHHCRFA